MLVPDGFGPKLNVNLFSSVSPYVIGTMNQGVSSSPNLELHHNFRSVSQFVHSDVGLIQV